MFPLRGIGTGDINQRFILLDDPMRNEAIHLYDQKHNSQ